MYHQMSLTACGANTVESELNNIFREHNAIANLQKVLISGGFRGGAGGARPPPPPAPKFFRFHAVFGKFWQNRMLAPPLGKSWIRRC